MTECIMCDHQIGDGEQYCVEDGLYSHTACREEWKRRHAAGECVICGSRSEHFGIMCDVCRSTDNWRYSGYAPPGGA